MKVRVADFFCGCGGTSAGLQAAGLKVVVGLDNDQACQTTFSHNFPNADFICDDIREIRASALNPFITKQRRYPLLFSACAPCQPYSRQNQKRVKRISRLTDASLLDELHRFIRFSLPEYVFIENVPGMQQVSRRTGPFARFIRLLARLNYHVDDRIVESQDFGVPQRRQRLVLLASRLGKIEIPSAVHGPGTSRPKFSTVREWIGHYPAITAGEEHCKVANHRARGLSAINLERLEHTPVGGGRLDWPKKLRLDCHKEHKGHTDVYGRLNWDRPASALTTKCITLSNGRFGHPEQNRAISVREAAALQTFEEDFIFFGSLESMARQIGNAVPVLLARAIGEAVLRHYRSYSRRLTIEVR